jgi:integrating conjugative element protein (TIGR03757 family)
MSHKVSKLSCQVPLAWLISLVLLSGTTFADQQGSNQPAVIEVFTSGEYSIIQTNAKGSGSTLRVREIIIYEVDGIQSIEQDLSHNLPAEPQRSKEIALQRLQKLDAQARTNLQLAATALAKAMLYGIHGYPAIVFDGEAVVYGVTDVSFAVERYRAWQTGKRL